MAKPTTRPTALAAEKTRLRNRYSGRTGSAARRSTSTNAAMAATAPMPRPMIGPDDQAQVVPPSEVSSTRQVAAAASSAVPR